jgi:PAS domain S-box-containing protein
MDTIDQDDGSRLFNLVALISAVLVFIIGIVGMIGLLLNNTLLTVGFSDYKPVAPSASLIWIILGPILAIHIIRPIRGISRFLSGIILLFISVYCCAEFSISILGGHTFLETGFNAGFLDFFGVPVTFISPVTSFLCISSALGILILLYRSELSECIQKVSNSVGLLGMVTDTVSCIFFLSYLLGSPFFYGTRIIPVSFPSVLAASLLGISLISASGPTTLPLSVVSGSSVRALLLRTFLPLTVSIIVFISFINIILPYPNPNQNVITIAFFLTIFIILTGYIVFRISSRISREIEEAHENVKSALSILTLTHRAAHSGSWDWIFSSSKLNWSEEFYQLFALPPDAEPSFETWLSVMHPDDREPALEKINQSVQEHSPLNNEYRIILPNGDIRWIGAWGNNSYNEMNEPVRMSGICIDITDKKLAEDALQESERRIADLIQFLPDATLAIDKEKRIIIWNKAIEEMTGIMAEEMIGKGDYAYTIPFYGEARPQLMDLIFEDSSEIATRYPKIIREGDALSSEVFCNALYDNKGAWVFAKASPLYDSSGNIVGAIESIRDINKAKIADIDLNRKNEELYAMNEELAASEEELKSQYNILSSTEKTLRETSQYLENLITYANVPIIIWNSDMQITRVNHAFEILTGRTFEDLEGKSLSLVFSSDFQDQSLRLIQNIQSGVKWETIEIPITHVDGSVKIVLWNSSTIYKPDGITPIATIAQGNDVTVERFLQQDKDRATNQIKENIAKIAILNDGIRNPLSVIAMYVEMAGNEQLSSSINNEIMQIDRIIRTLDQEWVKSEKILNFLQKHSTFSSGYGTFTSSSENQKTDAGTQNITQRIGTHERFIEEVQERLFFILDCIDAIVYVADLQTYELLFMNKVGRNIFGGSSGKKCYEVIQKDQNSPCSFCKNTYLFDQSGSPVMYQCEYQNTKNHRWYDIRDRVIPWTDGRMVKLEIAMDITERKNTEVALHKANERTTSILSRIADTFYSLDNSWRFTAVNPAAERAPFGRPAGELLGRVIWDLYPQLIRTPIHQHYLNAATMHTLEHYEAQSPLNKQWYEVFMQGWEGGVDVYLRDITERKQAIEKLITEKQFSESILETAQVIILVLDTEGRIVRFNRYMESISGYSLNEVRGMDWFKTFLHESDSEKIRDLFISAIHDIQTKGNVNPIITKDGREVFIEWYDKTLKDENSSVVGLISIGLDITDRKHAEESL